MRLSEAHSVDSGSALLGGFLNMLTPLGGAKIDVTNVYINILTVITRNMCLCI